MANKKDKNTPAKAEPMEENKFKAIQDILMGGEMRQIEQRFHQLQNRLEASQEALEKDLTNLKQSVKETQELQGKSLNDKLEELIQKLTEKVDRNHQFAKEEITRLDIAKTNRQELGKMFLMIGEALAKED